MPHLKSLFGKLGRDKGKVIKKDLAQPKTEDLSIREELTEIQIVLNEVKSQLATISSSLKQFRNPEPRDITDYFHKMYYSNSQFTWNNTYWLGIPIQKCPLDLWIYQEILSEVRPDVIIETGTFKGGSAYYLSSVCDSLNQGRIITIDIQRQENLPKHPRILYLSGSSIDTNIIQQVKKQIYDGQKVLVILDSDHSKTHVLNEMLTYGPLVSAGSYLIVEDTNINGHPVVPDFGPGPMEAVQEFLQSHKEFTSDMEREKFYFTFNPNGNLKKIKA
jgi:cephalosporin hydroxylase